LLAKYIIKKDKITSNALSNKSSDYRILKKNQQEINNELAIKGK